MYELPSREDIKTCIITKETVEDEANRPKLLLEDGSELA